MPGPGGWKGVGREIAAKMSKLSLWGDENVLKFNEMVIALLCQRKNHSLKSAL